MEWIEQFLQNLFKSDGWSGWKVMVVSNLWKKWHADKKEGNMSKNEEQMTSLAESIKAIEELYANDHAKQAYEKFSQLCNDYPDYQPQATAILARFSHFQNQCIHGILSMQQRSTTKSEIGYDFQICLSQFKKKIFDK